MAAVLGLDAEKIEAAIAGIEGVSIANYNCPGQIVITGWKESVEQAGAVLKDAGAKRVLPLNVSGPFHSPMLQEAAGQLKEVLDQIECSPLQIPYVTNVTGRYVSDIEETKELLIQQIAAPVRWQQSVEEMIRQGVDTFVEIGPGRTLSGFLRKINRDVKVYQVSTWEDIEKAGASRGIGRAIAEKLAEEGVFVVINYRGNEEQAKQVQQTIKEQGGNAGIYGCDVSDFSACEAFFKDVIETYGRLDILVNNAGITRDGLLMKMTESDYDAVLQTNLKGTFNGIRFASRQMLRQKAGRIINISSVSGILGNAGQANYSASKAGVIGLTKSAARELASRGITVNAVAPGFIKTEMTEVLSEQVQDHAKSQIPLGSFGNPEDVAEAVWFLASDKAGYITGQVLNVDGGMAM